MAAFISKIVTAFHGKDNLEHNFNSFYELTANDIHGNPFDFSTLKGKVVLIVNVASQCGLTKSNYAELQEIYNAHQSEGLEILAHPCNQFLGQEPGTNEQILDFGKTKYGVTFKLLEKAKVNGEDTHPVYRYLRSKTDPSPIDWNFSKFLVDRTGTRITRFSAQVTPKQIEPEIIKLLNEKAE